MRTPSKRDLTMVAILTLTLLALMGITTHARADTPRDETGIGAAHAVDSCETDGTCDDGEGALDGAAESCTDPQWADAPWCSGPSLRECPDGSEVPEDEPCIPECELHERSARGYCPGDDGHADELAALFADTGEEPPPSCEDTGTCSDPVPSCEEGGTCDDSCTPPARDDCRPGAAQLDELPATGPADHPGALLVVGLALVGLGLTLIRKVGLTNPRRFV